MIMMVKTPGSQMGSPAAAEEGGEEMGDEKCESGERSEVQARSTVASMVPKARSRSREVVTLDEEARISLRVSTKLPASQLSSMSTVIIALARTLACLSATGNSREHWHPRRLSKSEDGELHELALERGTPDHPQWLRRGGAIEPIFHYQNK